MAMPATPVIPTREELEQHLLWLDQQLLNSNLVQEGSFVQHILLRDRAQVIWALTRLDAPEVKDK